MQKIGHAGTLDPLAEGLLIILLNKATKLSSLFLGMDKEYRAFFKIGIITDSWDSDGRVIEERNADYVAKRDIIKVLDEIEGVFKQRPPIFSAKKINGKPAYYYARNDRFNNEEIKLKENNVNIYSASLVSFKENTAEINMRCSSGTYVRSVINEIGNRLSCGAVMTGLVRESIGDFHLKDSINIEDLRSIKNESDIRGLKKSMISVDDLRSSGYFIK